MVSELTEELTAKDIPWLMEAMENCRDEGHNETAGMLAEELQGILSREQQNET